MQLPFPPRNSQVATEITVPASPSEKILEREDEMAVDAVCCELLSAINSR
jgi:hypothetical protein